jgi:hypothetical protein
MRAQRASSDEAAGPVAGPRADDGYSSLTQVVTSLTV